MKSHSAAILSLLSREAIAFRSSSTIGDPATTAFARNNARRTETAASTFKPFNNVVGVVPGDGVALDVRPRSSSSSSSLLLATSSSSSSSDNKSFDSFDYGAHWYPVSWARDVPLNAPTRVTLFDVDYVIAKTDGGGKGEKGGDNDDDDEETFFAMIDECPHKKVALSEGRITECGDERYFQCSYHGWTFDGDTGECMEIPQTLIAQHNRGDGKPSEPKKSKGREDATAVAIAVEQGMVWLNPSRTPLEALADLASGKLLPPPRVPEMDAEEYKVSTVVRDFPIDWTVLLENIMDPDHGYFAHSSSATAAKGFDWYSSDGVDNRVQVSEEFDSKGGWEITSSVNAVEKLIKYNRDIRNAEEEGGDEPKGKSSKEEEVPKLATTTFVAPSLVKMGRRTAGDPDAPPPFVTAFWVCPTGVGKSRFMSAAIGKTPFAIPRWLTHMNLNNFLDQDTFLLLGQHRAALKREAEGYARGEGSDDGGTASNDVRKSTYVYRSPSERMPVRIGRFFDATLARAPNRREGVAAWHRRNAEGGRLFEPWPAREEVLDRYEQHTRICPDSADVVRRCDNIMGASKKVALAMSFLKLVLQRSSALAPAAFTNPFVSGVTVAAVRRLISQSASVACGLAERAATSLVGGRTFYSVLLLTFLSHSLASRVKREFFFKFDESLHREDVKAIAKNWIDL